MLLIEFSVGISSAVEDVGVVESTPTGEAWTVFVFDVSIAAIDGESLGFFFWSSSSFWSPLPFFHNVGERSRRPPGMGDENNDVRVLEEDSKDFLERYSLRSLLDPGGE